MFLIWFMFIRGVVSGRGGVISFEFTPRTPHSLSTHPPTGNGGTAIILSGLAGSREIRKGWVLVGWLGW